MNRQDILQLYPQLKLFLSYLKRVNLLSITLVIILYLLSAYCLLKGQMVLAVILATFAFILFQLSQKYLLKGLKAWLYRDIDNRKMLDFLEKEMSTRLAKRAGNSVNKRGEIKEFFILLDKVMTMVKRE